MTPIRLYIDEDAMARALVNGLRARGINVMTVYEEGLSGHSDAEQLLHATETGRVIYTFNVGDFCELHKDHMETGVEHSGIIVVYRQRYLVGEQIKRLLHLITTESAESMKNDLWFL